MLLRISKKVSQFLWLAFILRVSWCFAWTGHSQTFLKLQSARTFSSSTFWNASSSFAHFRPHQPAMIAYHRYSLLYRFSPFSIEFPRSLPNWDYWEEKNPREKRSAVTSEFHRAGQSNWRQDSWKETQPGVWTQPKRSVKIPHTLFYGFRSHLFQRRVCASNII